MSNVSDYLDWRGDLTFSASPFNEVDNLILSKMVGLDFGGIVPNDGEITLKEAAEKYFAEYGDEDRKLGVIQAVGVVPLMKKAVNSERFKDAIVYDYVNRIDQESEKQFSAITYGLSDGTRFVAYRGTDDTIVGWKEDFNLGSKSVVPAQVDATEYLEHQGQKFSGNFRVGGHSKGGNLAVYAAFNCSDELQDRLLEVFNNDGPGFRESLRNVPKYQRIQPRIRTIVPQYSFFGRLLAQDDDFEIVTSSVKGAVAHDGMTWEVLGNKFIRSEDFALRSQVITKTFETIGSQMTLEERQKFTDVFFDAITSSGATTLTDLTDNGLTQAFEIAKSALSDPQRREIIMGPIEAFIKEYLTVFRETLPQPIKAIKHALTQKNAAKGESENTEQ